MVFHPREPSPRRGAGQAAEPATERVARALARAGVASRRDAERLIEAGRVALNGQVLTSPAVNVRADDILTLDGKPVAEPEAVRVWRYHKPAGLLTTHKDPKGRPTVFDSLPAAMGRVISVGRLDLNSEGVLLLTNDGALARALELPANGWVRRYRARAFGRVSEEKLEALKQGVTIEGVNYGPIEAAMEKSGGGSNVWLTVAIREGKNREVRRVLEHLGLKVNRLIRVGYGPFELGDLEPGAVSEAPPRVIRDQLTEAVPPGRMPKGDRKLFNWSPGRDVRRARSDIPPASNSNRGPEPAGHHDDLPATTGRGGAEPTSASRSPASPKFGRGAAPKAAAASARGRSGASAKSTPAAPGRSSNPTGEKPAKPAYKAGWAKPKSKPRANPPGNRPTRKSGSRPPKP